jgi:hypothetical protein
VRASRVRTAAARPQRPSPAADISRDPGFARCAWRAVLPNRAGIETECPAQPLQRSPRAGTSRCPSRCVPLVKAAAPVVNSLSTLFRQRCKLTAIERHAGVRVFNPNLNWDPFECPTRFVLASAGRTALAWEDIMVTTIEYRAMALQHHRWAGMCRSPESREEHFRLEKELLALADSEERMHGVPALERAGNSQQ